MFRCRKPFGRYKRRRQNVCGNAVQMRGSFPLARTQPTDNFRIATNTPELVPRTSQSVPTARMHNVYHASLSPADSPSHAP